jgi:hypothetical protein
MAKAKRARTASSRVTAPGAGDREGEVSRNDLSKGSSCDVPKDSNVVSNTPLSCAPAPTARSISVNPLDALNPEDLILMSDEDFQETIRQKARAMSADAMSAIEDVMNNSDDDNARLVGAAKTLELAGAKEPSTTLPFGLTDEVFKIALAGLGQLASIAREGRKEPVLRDVTPAAADPRTLIDSSPLNAPTREAIDRARSDDDESIIEESLDVEE